MLRTIRLTAAIVCFTLITLLFLDFTGTLHTWFGWLAKIQFLPAVLALNIGVVLFLIVLTLLFGRIYCSVICPLGVFQDAVSWFSGKQKKNRFRYSPALKMAEIWCIGCIHPCLGCRTECFCRSTGTLQCIRPDGFQSAGSGMAMGK